MELYIEKLNDFNSYLTQHLIEFIEIEGYKGFSKPLSFLLTLTEYELYNLMVCFNSEDMETYSVLEGDFYSTEANKIIWSFVLKKLEFTSDDVLSELFKEDEFEKKIDLIHTKVSMALASKQKDCKIKYNSENENLSYITNNRINDNEN